MIRDLGSSHFNRSSARMLWQGWKTVMRCREFIDGRDCCDFEIIHCPAIQIRLKYPVWQN